jgi:hypothetical protein
VQHISKWRYNNYAADLYHYRAYLETKLTYGRDAASSHLTNAFWYCDTGVMGVCHNTSAETPGTNTGVARDATE